jgi:hypothetical protein
MSSITVVDRPLCCSSGACGPDPDSELMRFADDLTSEFEARGKLGVPNEPMAEAVAVAQMVKESPASPEETAPWHKAP